MLGWPRLRELACKPLQSPFLRLTRSTAFFDILESSVWALVFALFLRLDAPGGWSVALSLSLSGAAGLEAISAGDQGPHAERPLRQQAPRLARCMSSWTHYILHTTQTPNLLPQIPARSSTSTEAQGRSHRQPAFAAHGGALAPELESPDSSASTILALIANWKKPAQDFDLGLIFEHLIVCLRHSLVQAGPRRLVSK